MNIGLLEDKDKLLDFMFHPLFVEHCLYDDDTRERFFNNRPTSKYFYIEDSEIMSVVQFECMTPVLMCVHMFINPKYWGDDYGPDVYKIFTNWLKDTYPHIHKLLVLVPVVCRNVIMCAGKIGFQPEGIVAGGVYWRGKVVDMAILTKFIRGVN